MKKIQYAVNYEVKWPVTPTVPSTPLPLHTAKQTESLFRRGASCKGPYSADILRLFSRREEAKTNT